jgi:hypothetical protein
MDAGAEMKDRGPACATTGAGERSNPVEMDLVLLMLAVLPLWMVNGRTTTPVARVREEMCEALPIAPEPNPRA